MDLWNILVSEQFIKSQTSFELKKAFQVKQLTFQTAQL